MVQRWEIYYKASTWSCRSYVKVIAMAAKAVVDVSMNMSQHRPALQKISKRMTAHPLAGIQLITASIGGRMGHQNALFVE